MIQDTLNSIRVTLNERIGNPFLSASLIACVFLNWKLSLLLFSDVPYDNKVEKIVSFYPDTSTQFHKLLLIPVCFGLFWTFIWPVISLGINAYWYWMKSNLSNVKLKVERKKKLSEAEAAELYSMIDAQESKYLEFLKDRQGKIETLSHQISDLLDERSTLQTDLVKSETERKELVSKLEMVTSINREQQNKVNFESDERRRTLDEVSSRSLEFAEYLPGLKAITNAINKTTNYQADEAWIWEEFNRQEPSFLREDQQKMLNFFLALGLLKREPNSKITFGERYRNVKDRVLGDYNNSPGVKAQ